MRFKQSRIYVSTIPVWTIGFLMGFIGAIMGIGGGFLLVPMLIYFLRVPTNVVIGTSMVLTLVTMATATVLHSWTNHLVDAILALILMVGGVSGAQFGARAGQKMRGERLRLFVRRPLEALGANEEQAIGDIADADAVMRATQGASGVSFYSRSRGSPASIRLVAVERAGVGGEAMAWISPYR